MTIATGAPLPAGADAVVPVERAHVERRPRLVRGRRASSAITCGARAPTSPANSVVVSAGQPAAAARAGGDRDGRRRRAAAATACRASRSWSRATSSWRPGEPLRHGQIHESNSVLIAARCEQAGAEVVAIERVRDDAGATREALARALERADVVVTSGGVSVGTRDHVKPALAALGVEQLFWRLAVQPGRPTWCGLRDGRVVVGLPGNPLSVHGRARAAAAAGAAPPRGRRRRRARDVPAAADRRRCASDPRAAARAAGAPRGRRAPSRSAPTSRISSRARRSPMRSRSCPSASGELAAGRARRPDRPALKLTLRRVGRGGAARGG